MSDPSTPFGSQLEKELLRAGATQQQFAELLGVSQQTVSKWVTGETTPRLRHLPRIEELLDAPSGSLSALLFAARDPSSAPHGPRRSLAAVAALRRKMNTLTAEELALVESYIDELFEKRN